LRAYIVPSKTRGTWKLRYWENGARKEKQVGTFRDWPTRAEAEKANAYLLRLYSQELIEAPTVGEVVKRYRSEAMPERASTRRGYETWLKNHILPRWESLKITELKPDPVEVWLRDLPLASKTKRNIKGILTVLWKFAQKKELVPLAYNPMDLVIVRKVRGEKRRLPIKDLTPEQFQSLVTALESNPELQTMVIVTLTSGLRISETLGLQWGDINWLERTVTLNRGVVKQNCDDLKTEASACTRPLADDVLAVLTRWKQVSQFTNAKDWIFASPWKYGKQPVSYSWIWYGLSVAGQGAGIGHISSHAFRHSFRTRLGATETPIGVQKEMMRHSDIRTTMNIYGTADEASMRKAAEQVSRGFSAGKADVSN
jgi:integrase